MVLEVRVGGVEVVSRFTWGGLLVICLVRYFVNLVENHLFEKGIAVFGRGKLFVHNFESVRDGVVFAFKGSVGGKNLVINTFDEKHLLKRVEPFLFQVLIPLNHVTWNFRQHYFLIPFFGAQILAVFGELWVAFRVGDNIGLQIQIGISLRVFICIDSSLNVSLVN